MTPDDPPIRVNVERRLGKTEDIDEDFIDQTIVGVEEQNPPHGHRQERQEKTQPQHDFDKALQRRICASYHPGKEDRNQTRHHDPDERQIERVSDSDGQLWVVEGGHPAVDRPNHRVSRATGHKAFNKQHSYRVGQQCNQNCNHDEGENRSPRKLRELELFQPGRPAEGDSGRFRQRVHRYPHRPKSSLIIASSWADLIASFS